MEEEKEKLIIFVLLICVIGLLTVLGLNTFGVIDLCKNRIVECNCSKEDTNNSNNTVTPVDKNANVISDEEKEEVTQIIGLTVDGYKRLSAEDISDLKLTGKDYVDFTNFNVQNTFVGLSAGEYKTTELKSDDIHSIILQAVFGYGVQNLGITIKNIDEATLGISENDYKKIAKLYNLSENGVSYFGKDNFKNGYYLTYVTGDTLHLMAIDDSISYSKENNVITVSYKVKLSDADNKKVTYNKTFTYTFNKNTEGKYYLNTIKVVNNK